jgi:hypothetical protein
MPKIMSSAISFADYRPEVEELDLTFTSGYTYTFFDVPQSVYSEFIDSSSKGKFYNTRIRDFYRRS